MAHAGTHADGCGGGEGIGGAVHRDVPLRAVRGQKVPECISGPPRAWHYGASGLQLNVTAVLELAPWGRGDAQQAGRAQKRRLHDPNLSQCRVPRAYFARKRVDLNGTRTEARASASPIAFRAALAAGPVRGPRAVA